ncbi:DUF6270 domain-containing protein [Neobacillus cucumis]|uniref:DUF6270 domain-containing protein n=1 Tax=Neobacillus cucumis TaxID=1740721 RepID=UPI002E1CC791|nr:DUF6270 domain-containing protein [Neobacillus cucumis]
MYKMKDLSLDTQYMTLKFTSSEPLSNLKAELRLKDMTRYAVSAYNQFYEASVSSNEKNHEIKIELAALADHFELKSLTKQIVWIYINHNGEYGQLKLEKDTLEKLKKLASVHYCEIAKINFLNNKNSLGLNITKINVNCTVNKLDLAEQQLSVYLSPLLYNEKTLPLSKVEIKKRIFKDTLIYHPGVVLQPIDQNMYRIDLNELNTIPYDTVSNLDFIAEITDKNVTVRLPLLLEDQVKLVQCQFHKNLKSKLYSTAKKSLSIRVEKESPVVDIVNYELDGAMVHLQVDVSQLDSSDLQAGLFRQTKSFNDIEYTLYQPLTSHVQDTTLLLRIDLNDVFSDATANYGQDYSIALFNQKNTAVVVELQALENQVHKVKTEQSNITVYLQKKLKINVTPTTKKPVRISILGSCFSRAAFNSSNPFFNPDYKLYFNLDYSHFWISLISAVGEKIPFDISNYSDVPEKVLDNVRKEYEKTTFEDLRRVHSDYIVLDFFVDAVHGVRQLADGRFIGQNGDMHSSYYYKHKLLKETSQFDFRHPDFWDTWKKSCDEFISRLGDIMDLKKVILNIGGLSDPYYNESRESSSFSKDKKFTTTEITFINHTWERMNNYFLTKVPGAKVIDLTQYNYYASLDYPYGGSGPHHYERNYYKTFLGELAKVVLMDKLQ